MTDTDTGNNKWVLFDGDNTLWKTEPLYDAAREAFCRYVIDLSSELAQNQFAYLDKSLIEKCQRHRDIQLYQTHGYSFSRFARSFEDTLIFFLTSATSENLRHARFLAMRALDATAEPFDGVNALVDELLSRGFKLAIITAGERWVQQKRLNDFSLLNKFERHEVVERKTADDLALFCSRNFIDIESSWLIGDSIRSDIIPARTVGLNAIHFRSPNWVAEAQTLPPEVSSVDTLSEAASLISSNLGPRKTEG